MTAPVSPEALLNRARAAIMDEAWYEAQVLLRELIAARPGWAEAHCQLGSVLLKLKLHDDAVIAYEQASTLAPGNFEALLGLAAACRAAGRTRDAAAAFERALELRRDSIACLHDLAVLRLELGELEAALSLLNRGLSLSPLHAGLYSSLAQLNMIRGKLADAAWCAAKALQCDPCYTPAILKLAELDAASPLLDAAVLESRLSKDALALADRRNLGFAIGRIRHHSGDHRRAFAAWRIGNDAHRRIVERTAGPYERAITERQVRRIEQTYSCEAVKALGKFGTSFTQPIFVVGMTRSGTTLVEQILARHPDIEGEGERSALARVRDGFEQLSTGTDGRLLERLPPRVLETVARRYLDGLSQKAAASRHFVDKNPHNFWLIGLIAILFPQARIVHCHRDPVETCFSNYIQIFSPHHNYSNRLEDLAHYYNQYRQIMAHWERLELPNLLHLQYESLVEDPETVVRRLLRHCGVDWHEHCLAPEKSTRPVYTPSQIQVRQPINSSAIGRWRNYSAELEPLVGQLAP